MNRLMSRMLVSLVGVSLLWSVGCSVDLECPTECESWQECVDGGCRPRADYCDSSADCPPDRPFCDEGTHRCVEEEADESGNGKEGGEEDEESACGNCEEWEECEAGDCVPKPGRCNDHSDCEHACDTSTNTCVTDFCDPPCEEWEQCSGTSCTPRPGRCAAAADCPAEAPICIAEANDCVAAGEPQAFSSQPGVIVTSEELAPSFERLAVLHTLTGVATKVVTVEEICDGSCSTTDTRTDAPAGIKEWLALQEGLEYVLLGGGIEHVPAREVFASYSNALLGVSFEEDFVTDFYYADLSEWDKNGNGVYAEPEDHPAPGEQDVLNYEADLAVARLPVDTVAEADRYIGRVIDYLADKDLSRVRDTLLLSNVATTVDVGFTQMDIDGALYFDMPERTIDILPNDTNYTKLYSLGPTADSPDAETLTVARQRQEMESGHNLIVHSGHGMETYLTVEQYGDNAFTAQHAYDLRNAQLPIFLSCACSAGNFAYTRGRSAGESLINAPGGGAIGYLGNTATGLGLAGGNQFIDEFIRHCFSERNPRVGDCLRNAHHKLEYPDHVQVPILGRIEVVDRDSWEWTKKSVVYFGDPMIPVVTDPDTGPAPLVEVTREAVEGAVELVFSIHPQVDGVLTVEAFGSYYLIDVKAGEHTALLLAGNPVLIRHGFVAEGLMPSYGEHEF